MMNKSIMIAAAVLLLAACGEKDQTIGSSSYKPDEKAWQAASSPYGAKGYKGGDKAAWDAQMRQRIQVQNEYVRIN